MIIDERDIEERDEMDNNIMAAGGILMALALDLDAEVVTEDGCATNALSVKLPFMKSRYKITVERIPGTEELDPSDHDERG